MYTIVRFGNIVLPVAKTNYTLTPVPAQLSFVQTTSGVFDNDGSSRRRQVFPHQLSYKATVTEDTLAANRTILDALRAAVGTQALLYRTADDDGSEYYCTAILAEEPHERPSNLRYLIFEIELEFQQMSPWLGVRQGAGWRLDMGVLLDTDNRVLDEVGSEILTNTVTTFTRTNEGNYPTHDVRVVVTSGTAPITALSIWNSRTRCFLRWNGTLPSGGQLVIDTAACLVLNNGFDDYNNFYLYELFHRNEHWMEMAAGANQIQVTRTGGGGDSQISFVFNDTWA